MRFLAAAFVGAATLVVASLAVAQPGARPSGLPEAFFPMAPGTSWEWSIRVGPSVPMLYREVEWPRGDRVLRYAVRGRFPGTLSRPVTAACSLVLRVKSFAARQGNLRYPRGVEIEVVRDDLGIYDNHRKVFWAATTSGRFMVHEVIEYDPEQSPAHGPWGGWSEPGYAMRLIFFGERPGIAIGIGKEPCERLLFVGLIPAQSPARAERLHFRRMVDGSAPEYKEQSVLDKSFTEDLLFERGKGLVRLDQKVEGRPSMTWTLVKFRAGDQY